MAASTGQNHPINQCVRSPLNPISPLPICFSPLLSSKRLFLDKLFGWLQFGVTVAYLLVAYCYFGVAYTGYHAFGQNTGDQILYALGHPVWVVCVASVMVIVHVCGSFQVQSMQGEGLGGFHVWV